MADAAGLAGAKVSGSASAELAGYVAAAPGVAIFSGNDANPAATMRAGGAGVISGRSSAYPEVYAALRDETRRHRPRSRRGWTGSSRSGRASAGSSTRCSVRGLASPAARMTVDPPDPDTAAAIAAEVTALARADPSPMPRAGTDGNTALWAGCHIHAFFYLDRA